MLNPNAVLKTEIFERLTELSLQTVRHLPLDRHREIHADLQVLASAEFRQELHAKAVPELGWDGPNEPKSFLFDPLSFGSAGIAVGRGEGGLSILVRSSLVFVRHFFYVKSWCGRKATLGLRRCSQRAQASAKRSTRQINALTSLRIANSMVERTRDAVRDSAMVSDS